MIFVISPAKKLNFDVETKNNTPDYTLPLFPKKTEELMQTLKGCSAQELMKLMKLSPALAQLNRERNQTFQLTNTLDNHNKQAIFAFNGDVYKGLSATTFEIEELHYAQKHLRILSGLYGILRPLDLIQPHRLEMGTALKINSENSLYEFWQSIITDTLNELLQNDQNSSTLINLASNEYFKVINTKAINSNIITISFKEKQNQTYKTIGIYAKKARGLMCHYAIKKQISAPEELMKFNMDGYQFSASLSNDKNWVFIR